MKYLLLQSLRFRHGSSEYACQVFDKMSQRNLYAWTELIAEHYRNGRYEGIISLFHQMQAESVKADNYIYPKLLKACAQLMALQHGTYLHAKTIRTAHDSNVHVGNALMDMYIRCGSVDIARNVFDKMPQRDIITWNTMIAGYAHDGRIDDAVRIFTQFQKEEDVKPDVITWNTMLSSYVKSGQCEEAIEIFRKMQHEFGVVPNVISWTVMIVGFSQKGYHDRSLQLFHEMQQVGPKPDSVTISSVLSTCAHLVALGKGKEIHAYIVRNSFELHSFVGSALVVMYSACGCLEEAHVVFDDVPHRDRQVVLWNAMIACCAQHGHSNWALEALRHMQMACVKADSVTIASILPACAALANLLQGKEIHGYLIRNGLMDGLVVQNAIIDMYAKCGSLKYARLAFDKILGKDVVSWTAMIGGYGMHGFGEDAISMFCEMQRMGIKPQLATFTCVLSACSHAGLLDQGLEYFDCMTRHYQIKPGMEQYACTVDLLGRAGRLDEAQKLIESMPFQANACLWGALLNACRIHSNVSVGEYAAKQLYRLEPENVGNYLLIANIYAAIGRWKDVAKVKNMMEEGRLRKAPGCSWIEVSNKLHAFVQGEGLD